MKKSTVEEIQKRFDNDLERFSNLETGQVSTIDAKISLELMTESAKRITPHATQLLDIGCGAGNYTLKMLTKISNLNCTLLDLSKPMLDKAENRVSTKTKGHINIIQGDIRNANLKENYFDIILAGAVLHHLRDDNDWLSTFSRIFKLLKNGGCFLISDLIMQDSDIVNEYIWDIYSDYLDSIGGVDYRKKVLDYIEKEDSPRSLNYQLELMKKVGFKEVDILHKNMCFATFGGIK